jgi:hypothetical protein
MPLGKHTEGGATRLIPMDTASEPCVGSRELHDKNDNLRTSRAGLLGHWLSLGDHPCQKCEKDEVVRR